MAKRAPTFNFGANVKPSAKKASKTASKAKKSGGKKKDAWKQYASS